MQLNAAAHAVHRYLGLAVGTLICVLGLSGSLLVFRPELERVARPELFDVGAGSDAPPASLEDMRALAAAALPDLELYRIRLAQDEREPYEFILGLGGKFTHHLYVDPYARRVLGVKVAGEDPFLWMQSLHFDLLGGTSGRSINGGVAVGVLLLLFTGMVLWLRSSGNWRARLLPRFRARAARRNWGIHAASGFWALPFLTLMAATALYFAFHEPVANFIHAITRSKAPALLPRLESRDDRVSLDSLLAQGRALEPNAKWTVIRLPRTKGLHLTLNYVLAGDLSDLGANAIHFDPATGAMLRRDRLRDLELGPRVVAALVPLHFGTFGGVPTRILWSLAGLLPTVLFVTGIAIWRRRRSSRPLKIRVPVSEKQLQFLTR